MIQLGIRDKQVRATTRPDLYNVELMRLRELLEFVVLCCALLFDPCKHLIKLTALRQPPITDLVYRLYRPLPPDGKLCRIFNSTTQRLLCTVLLLVVYLHPSSYEARTLFPSFLSLSWRRIPGFDIWQRVKSSASSKIKNFVISCA